MQPKNMLPSTWGFMSSISLAALLSASAAAEFLPASLYSCAAFLHAREPPQEGSTQRVFDIILLTCDDASALDTAVRARHLVGCAAFLHIKEGHPKKDYAVGAILSTSSCYHEVMF